MLRPNKLRINVAFFLILFIGINMHEPLGQDTQRRQAPIVFVIHGGAGTIDRREITPQLEHEYREKLKDALTTGYDILKKGGSSLDAVETAIKILEDSPLFNAGKGSVFTNAGTNELDASIMDGKTLNAGAVAAVKRIKNPISLARLVMEKSPHVMMIGSGAETFAKQNGINFVPQSYFFTEKRWKALQQIKEDEKTKKKRIITDREKHGTVGAVALDKYGNLAAGTSTGGMTNKRFGRVGDSPIIGAGTYADNRTCAVSATGHGEYFMRAVVAYDVSALIKYKGLSLKDAAHEVVMVKLKKLGGTGGLIAADKDGNIAMPFNSQGMYRASIDKDGKINVEIY
jgi:L-asparaginase / beta-aspartyl-peptidase